METRNCACRTGRIFGINWIATRRCGEQPKARAFSMNVDDLIDRTPAHTTRAVAAQPKSPSSANVITPLSEGDRFSGSMARTVIRRKSHGNERKTSIATMLSFSQSPPRNPATVPTSAAKSVDNAAAAGARSSETLVANRRRANRSRPSSSVPSRKREDGGEFGFSRNCFACPAGANTLPPSEQTKIMASTPIAIALTSFTLVLAPTFRSSEWPRHLPTVLWW